MDSDLLNDLISRLVMLRWSEGDEAFRKAIAAARINIGRNVLAAAEHRAGVGSQTSGNVVRFPTRTRSLLDMDRES